MYLENCQNALSLICNFIKNRQSAYLPLSILCHKKKNIDTLVDFGDDFFQNLCYY